MRCISVGNRMDQTLFLTIHECWLLLFFFYGTDKYVKFKLKKLMSQSHLLFLLSIKRYYMIEKKMIIFCNYCDLYLSVCVFWSWMMHHWPQYKTIDYGEIALQYFSMYMCKHERPQKRFVQQTTSKIPENLDQWTICKIFRLESPFQWLANIRVKIPVKI